MQLLSTICGVLIARFVCLQIGGQQAAVVRTARPSVVVRAAATSTLSRQSVPLELEEGPMPLNTFNNKAPFKAKIKSVERIVGPKATGETCNIVIETEGKIPFWEGQSYGVIPPVSATQAGSRGAKLTIEHSRCCDQPARQLMQQQQLRQ